MLKTACTIGLKTVFTAAASFAGYAAYLAVCQWHIEPALRNIDMGSANATVAFALFATQLASPFLAGYAGYKLSNKFLKNSPA